MVAFDNFGAYFNLNFLAPTEYENRLKTAETLISIAGFSAVILALLGAWNTIREGQLKAELEILLFPKSGKRSQITDGDCGNVGFLMIDKRDLVNLKSEFDLAILNKGNLVAQNIVVKMRPAHSDQPDINWSKFFVNAISSEDLGRYWEKVQIGND